MTQHCGFTEGHQDRTETYPVRVPVLSSYNNSRLGHVKVRVCLECLTNMEEPVIYAPDTMRAQWKPVRV